MVQPQGFEHKGKRRLCVLVEQVIWMVSNNLPNNSIENLMILWSQMVATKVSIIVVSTIKGQIMWCYIFAFACG